MMTDSKDEKHHQLTLLQLVLTNKSMIKGAIHKELMNEWMD